MPMAALAASIRALVDAPDAANVATMLGQVTVPALGDACALYVLDAAGLLRPAGRPAGTPATPLLNLYEYETASDQATAGYTRIALAGRLLMVTACSDTRLTQLTESPTHLALLQAVGFASLVFAPLTARGSTVGLLVISATGAPRQYDQETLSLVEMLGAATASVLTARDVEQRETQLRSRLDGMSLAARELAHALNNNLTLPIGVIELLLERPDLPRDIREMIAASASDLAAAEQQIRAYQVYVRGGAASPPGSSPRGEEPR